jgi:hypothetical protein
MNLIVLFWNRPHCAIPEAPVRLAGQMMLRERGEANLEDLRGCVLVLDGAGMAGVRFPTVDCLKNPVDARR